MCECLSKNPDNLLLPPSEDEEEKLVHITTKNPMWNTNTKKGYCRQTSDGIMRIESEEWADQCRRCICKNGSEMCSLITCNPPSCEHPVFFPGDCCPRCPGSINTFNVFQTLQWMTHSHYYKDVLFSTDEEMGPSNFNVSVCQSSDGSQRLEGEMWNLSPCLTCTCHSGQVLCTAPDCPPTPCPNSFMKNPHDCCLSCPSKGEKRDGDILEQLNAFTNNSSHSKKPICLSDDSAKSYSEGETWKVWTYF